MGEVAVVTTMLPDSGTAGSLVSGVLEAKFAACGHVREGGLSSYWWKGRLEVAKEWEVRFTTTVELAEALAAWISASHPYELPSVTTAVLEAGDTYAAWVSENTGPFSGG